MNKEKFKQLSFREKVQWLIQYYGVATVIAIIAVIVAFFFLKSVFFPEKMADVIVLMLSEDVTPAEALSYVEELTEITGKEIEIASYMKADVYSEASFAAKIGVDQNDLILAPKEETEQLVQGGLLRESQKIAGRNLYLSVPFTGRENEDVTTVKEYLIEHLTN